MGDEVMVQCPPEYTLSIDLSNGEDNTVYVMTKDQTVIECGVYDGNMRTIVEQLISETIQIPERFLHGPAPKTTALFEDSEIERYHAFVARLLENQRRWYVAARLRVAVSKPKRRLALSTLHRDNRRWIGHAAGMRACANTRLRTVKTSGLRGGS